MCVFYICVVCVSDRKACESPVLRSVRCSRESGSESWTERGRRTGSVWASPPLRRPQSWSRRSRSCRTRVWSGWAAVPLEVWTSRWCRSPWLNMSRLQPRPPRPLLRILSVIQQSLLLRHLLHCLLEAQEKLLLLRLLLLLHLYQQPVELFLHLLHLHLPHRVLDPHLHLPRRVLDPHLHLPRLVLDPHLHLPHLVVDLHLRLVVDLHLLLVHQALVRGLTEESECVETVNILFVRRFIPFFSAFSGLKSKKPIQTKYRLPLLNWQALKPNQVTGTVFNELDDEQVLGVRIWISSYHRCVLCIKHDLSWSSPLLIVSTSGVEHGHVWGHV